MKKEVISSCPFCGSKKVVVARTNPDACWIECDRCGGSAASRPTRKGAITLWNRRHDRSQARIVHDSDRP